MTKIWELTDWHCSENIYDSAVISIYQCGKEYIGFNIVMERLVNDLAIYENN